MIEIFYEACWDDGTDIDGICKAVFEVPDCSSDVSDLGVPGMEWIMNPLGSCNTSYLSETAYASKDDTIIVLGIETRD